MEVSAPDDGWDGWGDSKAGDKTAPAAAKPPSGGFHSDWRDRIGDDDAGEGVFDWDDEPGGNQESEATDKAASDDGESDGTDDRSDDDDSKDDAGGWDDWDSGEPETDKKADQPDDDDSKDDADGGNPPVSDWERDGERDAARPLPLKPILIAVGAAVLVTACVFGMLQYRRVEAHKAAVEAHTAACRTLESDSAEYRRLRRELADLKVKVDEPKTPDCSQSTTDAIRKADKRLGQGPDEAAGGRHHRRLEARRQGRHRQGRGCLPRRLQVHAGRAEGPRGPHAEGRQGPQGAGCRAEVPVRQGRRRAGKGRRKEGRRESQGRQGAADKAAAEKAKADEEARKAAEEQARRQAEAQAQAQSNSRPNAGTRRHTRPSAPTRRNDRPNASRPRAPTHPDSAPAQNQATPARRCSPGA